MKVSPKDRRGRTVHRILQSSKVKPSDYSRSGNSVSVGLLWMRSGEVRRPLLDDIDWSSKKSRRQTQARRLPLNPLRRDVGDTILKYLTKAEASNNMP